VIATGSSIDQDGILKVSVSLHPFLVEGAIISDLISVLITSISTCYFTMSFSVISPNRIISMPLSQ
jgi:hypothetical protein